MDNSNESKESSASTLTQLFSTIRQTIAPTVTELYDRAMNALRASPIQDEIVKECIQKLFAFKTTEATFQVLLLYYFHIENNIPLSSWFTHAYPRIFKGDPGHKYFLACECTTLRIVNPQLSARLVEEVNAQFNALRKETGSDSARKLAALAHINVLLACVFSTHVAVHNRDAYTPFTTKNPALSTAIMQMFWNIVQTGDSAAQKNLEKLFYSSHCAKKDFFDVFVPLILKPQQLALFTASACEEFAKIYASYLKYLEQIHPRDISNERKEEFKAVYNILLTHGASLDNQYCISAREEFQRTQEKLWHYTEIAADSGEGGNIVAQTWQSPFSAARVDEIVALLTAHFEQAENILDTKLNDLNSAMELRKHIIYNVYKEDVAALMTTNTFHTEITPAVITLANLKSSILAHVALHTLLIKIQIGEPTKLDVTALAKQPDNGTQLQFVYKAGRNPFSMAELSLFISALSHHMPNHDLVLLHPSYAQLYKIARVPQSSLSAKFIAPPKNKSAPPTNTSMSASNSSFAPGTIPIDIWSNVAAHLPLRSLHSLFSTCTFFHNAPEKNSILTSVCDTTVSIQRKHNTICTGGTVYTTATHSAPQTPNAPTTTSRILQPIELKSVARLIIEDGTRSFVVMMNGRLYAWGKNEEGQLGLGHKQNIDIPSFVGIPEPVESVTLGWGSTFAITCSGKLYAWGHNDYGQLGLGHGNSIHTPEVVLISERVKLVVCQGNSTLAVTDNGKFYAWGSNVNDDLPISGRGPRFQSYPTPVPITIKDCSAQKSTSPLLIESCTAANRIFFVIARNGALYSWGGACHDSQALLGTPRTSVIGYYGSRKYPQLVNLNEPIQSVAASDKNVFAITYSGKLYAWGCGQLGVENIDSGSVIPVLVPIDEPVQTVVVNSSIFNSSSVFALTRSGNLYAWGDNSAGQLGLGHLNSVDKPMRVTIPSAVKWVASNYTSTFIFTVDGHLYGCGNNEHNQLALPNAASGGKDQYDSPQKVTFPTQTTEPVQSTGFKNG